MNKDGRKQIDGLIERLNTLNTELESIKGDIETLRDDEESKFDNMSESLQQGEKGQAIEAAKNALEEACSSMENIDLEEIINNLETAKE